MDERENQVIFFPESYQGYCSPEKATQLGELLLTGLFAHLKWIQEKWFHLRNRKLDQTPCHILAGTAHCWACLTQGFFPKQSLLLCASQGDDEYEASSSGLFDFSETQVLQSTSCTLAWCLQHFHGTRNAAPRSVCVHHQFILPWLKLGVLSGTERVYQVPRSRKLLLAGS